MAFRRYRHLAVIMGWSLALRGALTLHNAPGSWGHFLCGPWGCAPPVQALAALHLAWSLVLAPLAYLWSMLDSVPRALRIKTATCCLTFGAVAAGVLVGRQLVMTAPYLSVTDPVALLRMAAFSVATQVDLPALQLVALGGWCRRRLLADSRRVAQDPAIDPIVA